MIFNEIFDIYGDDIEVKEEKVKAFFENLLNTHVEVKLRITDPRVNCFSVYVSLTDEIKNKLQETFGEIQYYGFDEQAKPINSNKFGLNFVVFDVEDEDRQKLIQAHDIEHEVRLKKIKKIGIIF